MSIAILHEVELELQVPSGQTGFGMGGFGKGGFGEGEEGTLPSQYKYALTDHPSRPLFVSKLRRPLSLNRSLPVPGQRGDSFFAQTASVEMSNTPSGDLVETPTVSYLTQTTELRGGIGKARILVAEDTGAGVTVTTLLELVGRIGAMQTLNRQTAAFPIAIEDQSLRSKKIPARTTLSVFPSADTSIVSSQDHPVIWVFGDKCLVELALVLGANFLRCVFILTGGGNQFLYEDLTSIADTDISTGYFLEYDAQWDQSGALIAMDLGCTDGTRLKNVGAVDQNGLDAAPITDLGEKPTRAFYRRRIPLDALAGKTVNQFLVACEHDTPGTWAGRIGQAVIVDSQGVVIREIITRRQQSFTVAIAFTSNGGNSATLTKNNRDHFGAFRKPGSITVHAIYRNASVVPSAEYDVSTILGLGLIRFGENRPQVDGQGKPVKILALLSSSEYASGGKNGNPALVRKSLLSDTTDGAGQAVDAAAFTTAEADTNTAQIWMGGGLDRQWGLPDLLAATSYLGAHLWRDSTGAFQDIVDKASRYTNAPINLEEGTEKSLNNIVIQNATDASHAPVQTLTVRGYQAWGLSNQESWLLRTTRKRDPAIEGGAELTLDYPFLTTETALDRAAHWHWEQLLGYDERLDAEMTVLQDAIQLALWHKVQVDAPNLFKSAQYFIRDYAIDGNRFHFELQRYRAAVYTYARGTDIFVDSKATIGIDYSQTYPLAPTFFRAGTSTVRPSTTGEIEALTTFLATAPSVNVSHLGFRLLRSATAPPLDEIRKPCVPGEVDVSVEFTLFAGNDYLVQCYAYNEANFPPYRAGAFASALNVTGAENTAPPSRPTWKSLAQGNGRMVLGEFNAAPETDIEKRLVYRGTESNTANMTLVLEIAASTLTFTDNDFEDADYGDRFYYAFKTKRKGLNGGVSAFSIVRSVLLIEAPSGPSVIDTQTESGSGEAATGSAFQLSALQIGAAQSADAPVDLILSFAATSDFGVPTGSYAIEFHLYRGATLISTVARELGLQSYNPVYYGVEDTFTVRDAAAPQGATTYSIEVVGFATQDPITLDSWTVTLKRWKI